MPTRHEFLHGSCVSLAIAIHDITGWPLIKITEEWNVARANRDRPRALDGSALHWVVEDPSSGDFLDIDGPKPKAKEIEKYEEMVDDPVAWGLATRPEAMERKREAGVGCPIEDARPYAEDIIDQSAEPRFSSSSNDPPSCS